MCAKLVLALLAAMSCLLLTPRVSTRSVGGGLAVLASCFATVGAQEGTWGDSRFNAQDPERDRSVAKLLMKQAKEEADPHAKMELYRDVIKIKNDHQDALRTLGILLLKNIVKTRPEDKAKNANLVEAKKHIKKWASSMGPNARNDVTGLCHELVNIGHTMEGQDRPIMAKGVYLLAQKIQPEHGNSAGCVYKVREWLCEWDERDQGFSKVMRIVDGQLERGERTSLQPMTALSQDVGQEKVLSIARSWSRAAYQGRASTENDFISISGMVAPPLSPDGRLSVGFLSADFRPHAVAHQVMTLIAMLRSRERVRLTAFNCFEGDIKGDGREIRSHMHDWVDVKGRESDRDVAAKISSHSIHVIIDMSGHTGGSRMGALSFRPAPVSMTFLGYPATTGADFIDYYLSDRVASPPESLRHYSESLVYLPGSFYPLNHGAQITATPPRGHAGLLGSGKEGVTFACFNRNLKIKPDIFSAWCEIVKASPPGTVLWLRRFHKRIQENLIKEASDRGLSDAQIAFAGRIANRTLHLARHGHIDLYLDTPRFGGHSTLADALWTGTPALVLPGEGIASRIGTSMASAFGLNSLIARDLQDYRHLAVRLAGLPEAFKRLRKQTYEVVRFDEAIYAERLERAWRLAYDTFDSRKQNPREGEAVRDPHRVLVR